MAKQSWRLGEILLQKGYITWEQLEEGLKLQKEAEKAAQLNSMVVGSHVTSAKHTPVLNLGEVLVRHGWIGWDQLSDALALQKMTGKILGKILLEKGFVSEKDLQRALAIQFNMTFVDFEKVKIPHEVVQIVPKQLAYEFKAFPLVKKGDSLLIAISDPHNVNAEMALQKIVPGHTILVALATADDIQKALEKYYGPI